MPPKSHENRIGEDLESARRRAVVGGAVVRGGLGQA
jgi:hypothetical protein